MILSRSAKILKNSVLPRHFLPIRVWWMLSKCNKSAINWVSNINNNEYNDNVITSFSVLVANLKWIRGKLVSDYFSWFSSSLVNLLTSRVFRASFFCKSATCVWRVEISWAWVAIFASRVKISSSKSNISFSRKVLDLRTSEAVGRRSGF